MSTSSTDTEVLSPLPISPAERIAAATTALTRSEPYDLSEPVIGWVERYAASHPDRAAVEDPWRTVNYAALAEESRRAAAELTRRGVEHGDIVAVGGERGAEVITTFLGLELLGAVYLPMDPAWPPARVAEILRDSGAVLAVTTGLESSLSMPLLAGAKSAGCPAAAFRIAPEPLAGLPSLTSPNQVRYLLYTSGSTGKPKGALVEHQGMLNHLMAKIQDLGLDGGDRIAQTAPLGFDISVWQMLAALVAGGTVQVIADDEAHDAARLLAVLARRGTTVVEAVPTLIRLLLDEHDRHPQPHRLAGLRWMIATGEELPPAVARHWLESFPDTNLLNAYGPTECSDDVTHARLTSPGADVRHLPIGGPIGNAALYVLRRGDQEWLACPPGETGELFVGGVVVGRGYLGDPARTAEAFFADPFAGHGRLYRTGDAVRLLPSGQLEYLGRVDRQVKVAGVRMELAEIEAVLSSHPDVSACAVTVAKTGDGVPLVARESAVDQDAGRAVGLVAYLSWTGDQRSHDELRRYLAERLPLPMVPQIFVELADLPLTRNGKIDYAALPALAPRERAAARPFTAPQGPVETTVATGIGAVLGLSEVGRYDTFLELGGDSLQAMRLVSRLHETGVGVTLRGVLLDGSPAALARAGSAPVAEQSRTLPVADGHPGSSLRTRPLTPQQAGVYFHWRLEPDNPYYSYQGTLRLSGPLDQDQLGLAWEALLQENPLLLARFDEKDGEPVHEFPHWSVPLPAFEDLGPLEPAGREHRYRTRAYAEAARPFDLRSEPALRVQAFALGDLKHRLLVTMHEILLDGWGATVLFQRLAELYGIAGARPPAAELKRVQRYERYLDWHEALLTTTEMAAAGEYWRTKLDGELPVLDLAERARPPRPSYRGAIVEAVVGEELTDRLRSAAVRARCTPFILLLTAYALALTYYGDTNEVVIGAPMANRDRPEQIDVPAFMLAMLPFRIAVRSDSTLDELVESVRDAVMDGYAAADYPLGWTIQRLAKVARSNTATPVFQTMLNMLTYPTAETTADGVSFRFVELDTGFTKYDCALYVQPHGSRALLAQFAYQNQLLDAAAARRVLDTTLLALRALIGSPGTKVRALNLLPEQDLPPSHHNGS